MLIVNIFCLILSISFAQKKNVEVQMLEDKSSSVTDVVLNVFRSKKDICSNKINSNAVLMNTSYSQGKSNWCSPFAVSQVLSQIVDEPISPAFSAVMVSKTRMNQADIERNQLKTTKMNGSSFSETLSMLDNMGYYCAEKDLPTSLRDKETFQQDYDYLEEFDIKTFKKNPKLYSILQHRFPFVTIEVAKKILSQIRPQDRLYYLVNENCRDHKRYFKQKYKTAVYVSEVTQSKKLPISKIDEILNDGRIAGITYDIRLLQKKGSAAESKHSSVVIGRRYNEQSDECEYLIRNSYGNSCSSYKDNIDCSQKEVPGSIWIKEGELERALYYVVEAKLQQKKEPYHLQNTAQVRNYSFKN